MSSTINEFATFTSAIAARPDEFFAKNDALAARIKEHLKKIADAGESFER
jgi:hypothetical protein